MLEGKGNCEHGEFDLKKGCPMCIAARKEEAEVNSPENIAKRIAEVQPKPIIVKVRYYSITSGEVSPREYTYYSEDRLTVGDIVTVQVRDTTTKAEVSAIDVPEEEIAAFKDKVKTIPADSIVKEEKVDYSHPAFSPDPNAWRTGEEEIRTEPETEVALRPFEDYEAHDCFLESERVLEIAKNRAITTLEESQAANNDLALMSKLTKVMNAKLKALLDPHKTETDSIRDTYKYLMAPIIEANSITKSKMLAFDTKQRQIQQEQERINQQKMATAQAEMNLKGELTESVNLVEVAKAPERVKTELGTSFKTDRWKYRIVNLDLVPREWMIPAHDMLSSRATKHHDTMPVLGIEFYNDPYYTVRTK